MRVFYLQPKYRTPHEFLKVREGFVHIRLWQELPPNPNAEKIKCMGYQWLLTGRGQKIGRGIYEVWRQFPDLNRIRLEFVELKFESVSTDGKGKLDKKASVDSYLIVEAQRDPFLREEINSDSLQQEMRTSTKTCVEIGRRFQIGTKLSL